MKKKNYFRVDIFLAEVTIPLYDTACYIATLQTM